jgi:hypothetical protein
MAAEQFAATVADEFAERRAGQRSGGHPALVCGPVDEFPRLREVVTGRQFPAEQRGEPAAAPEVAAVDGRKG